MKDHSISTSGIQLPQTNKLYTNPILSPYANINLSAKVLNLVLSFKGEIWRSNYRIIVKIPSEAWIRYGNGEMDVTTAHHFEQVAWIQISQFDAHDLISALNHQ